MGIDTLSAHIIPASSQLHRNVSLLCKDTDVVNIIEVGSGMGDGLTMDIVRSFSTNTINPSRKLRCIELSKYKYDVLSGKLSGYSFAKAINGNSVSTGSYMSKQDISDFYWGNPDCKFRKRELDYVYPLLSAELSYISIRSSVLTNSAIASAITEIGNPDMVILCGSEFCSEADGSVLFENEPKYVVLYDTSDIRNYSNAQVMDNNISYNVLITGNDGDYDWQIFKHT